MSARGFLGAGDLYIARQVSGVFEEFSGPYECSKFEIKPNTDLKELVSKGRTTYGQVIESVAIAQPSEFTVELPEVNKETLAIALLGTTTAVTQASGSITAEVVTISAGKIDKWLQLSKGNLTGSQTVTNSGASTTFVEGTDYLIEKTTGMIKILSSGTADTEPSLKVTSTYGTIAGQQIAGGTVAQIRAKFRLVGKNFVDDTDCIVNVLEGIVAADSAFDFLSDDFATVSLPGRMKTPSGQTAPFTVDLR